MAEFIYNNAKNRNTGHMAFKLNCGYSFWILYKDNINSYSKSKTVNELLAELKKMIIFYYKNPYYAQELQNCIHNKGVKPNSYVLGDKFWLNNKYINTK